MLQETDIQRLTNNASYIRGIDIYHSNKIYRLTIEEDGDVDYIAAYVKGSRRNIYHAYIDYDRVEESITDIYCECPAFAKYEGICKHCVAILLEYRDFYEDREEEFEAEDDLFAQTTPGIKQLLAEQIARKTLQITKDSTYGSVCFDPFLVCNSDEVTIEFKIGVTKKYVLKDVQDDGIELTINNLFGYQGDSENIYFDQGMIYRVPHSKLEPIRGFLKTMAKINNRTVYIHEEDIPTFSRELLPVLEEHFICDKGDFNEVDYGVVPVGFEVYLDAPAKDFITCKVMAVYGDEKYNIFNKSQDANLRDLINEIAIGNIIFSYFDTYNNEHELMVIDGDEDKIYELLVNGIPKIYEMGEVYITDKLKRLKVISAPKVAVGVSIIGDLMELQLTSDDISKEQLVEILTKYNLKKRFYRLKNGSFINVAGEDIEAFLELKQGLQLTPSQLAKSNIEIPKYRALYLDSEFKERNSLSMTKDKDFKALIRNMKTVEDNDFDIPHCLENIMGEYQKRGYLWIKTLQHNGFGGILADDMGLGKTLQI